jgi:predicted transglutaminase-like cysteine proteinase
VRQTIKTIAVAAAIGATATVTLVQQVAKADLGPQAAVSAKDLQQSRSDGSIAVTDLKHFGPEATDGFADPQQFRSEGPIAFVDLQQPTAFNNYSPLKADSPQFTFLNSPQVSFPDSPQAWFFQSANAAHSPIELLQPVSLEQPAQPTALTPAPHPGLAPQRSASVELPRDTDLPPARHFGLPMSHIRFDAPALAPMAHTFFCLKYPADCKVEKTVPADDVVTLTAQRWGELVRINATVNRAIIPHPNTRGLAGEVWLISPREGECHDYAVTKRHELLALGWPERDLLLSEVVTSWGEHHLVLVIRSNKGDFVADNLDPNIRTWTQVPYQWVRVQSPGNPMIWSTIESSTVSARAARRLNPS